MLWALLENCIKCLPRVKRVGTKCPRTESHVTAILFSAIRIEWKHAIEMIDAICRHNFFPLHSSLRTRTRVRESSTALNLTSASEDLPVFYGHSLYSQHHSYIAMAFMRQVISAISYDYLRVMQAVNILPESE